MDIDIDFDLDDGRSNCPECGEPMSSDEDGDGVMTMSYEFCENCGEKTYGSAVEATEALFAFARKEGLMPDDRLHNEQPRDGGG